MSRVYLDRAIFTTITVMSVRIVYDGGQNLKLGVRRWDNPRPSARHVHLARLLSILVRRAELKGVPTAVSR
jgi:hypothetical protein